jgi:hypothetical protein
MTRSTIAIVKQEYQESPKPYRLIETYPTMEGMRTRVCSGSFTTYEAANDWRATLISEAA